jgi:hypothetical protein
MLTRRQTPSKPKLDAETKKRVDACYDRLSNPKNFHGMYRERFREKGLIEGESPSVQYLLHFSLSLIIIFCVVATTFTGALIHGGR